MQLASSISSRKSGGQILQSAAARKARIFLLPFKSQPPVWLRLTLRTARVANAGAMRAHLHLERDEFLGRGGDDIHRLAALIPS